MTLERPAKRAKLLSDDEDSDLDGASGVALKVNEDYAKRFEHNKKREERQRLEEKYGKGRSIGATEDDEDEDDEDSDDETEDEDGLLATGDLDAAVTATLQALRSKDPRVYDKTFNLYQDAVPDDEATEVNGFKKEKPMHLRDYHRENLLKGLANGDDGEDVPPPKTYVERQEELKRSVVAEMHAAAEDDEEAGNDDDFLVRKPGQKAEPRPVVAVDVEAADKDPDTFLSNFLAARAWVPTERSQWQPFESDDEEEDQRAEAFEAAYNLRFENPEGANEKLVSHARDMANKFSVRRTEVTGRKKERELKKAKKEAEKKEREEDKARLRKLKIEEAEEKLKKIKEAAGLRGKSISVAEWGELLEEDWDDDQWEKEMNKRFGDAYYAEVDDVSVSDDEDAESAAGKQKKKPKKPKWDDDIDIKDLVPEFEDDDEKKFSLSDEELDAPEEAVEAEDDMDEDPVDGDKSTSKSKKPLTSKDRKLARAEEKRAARKERRIIESLVDASLPLTVATANASSANPSGFRYRETSPTSYGLTARDILFADDAQLNQYAGLKKFATFRDPAKKAKDKKKLGKKARLRQWRVEVFGDEEGPKVQQVKGDVEMQDERREDGVDIRQDGGAGKKKKRSRKRKAIGVET